MCCNVFQHRKKHVEEKLSSDIKELPIGIPADQHTEGAPASNMVSLVEPSRLSNDQCDLLKVGAFGCQVKPKSEGQTSSPLLLGDHVCQCRFIGFKNMTCDNLFRSDDSVFMVKRLAYPEPTVFGKEGCDCYGTERMLSMCDLAVRGERV
mmetsp:Transcript_67744/g.130805  ORF Transcript_67744/g.130805 Transcript_67744/m.130805 type:complete len:150 (-) Transcript_67744:68-517(-)